MPEVTVLLAVHNGARFLPTAIESVLAQTFRDFQLVVVDDASTDDTPAIIARLADPRFMHVRNPQNFGLARSLNIGLAHATGKYVARLDHDDVSHAGRLAAQAAWLGDHPHTALVGSLARLIDEHGQARGLVERPTSIHGIRWMRLLENPFIHSTVMFRRDLAAELGGYSESAPLAEDFDFWGRFIKRFEVANLDRPLVDYRGWSESIMSSVEQDPHGRRRAELRQSVATLIRRHAADEFGGEPLTEADADLLAGLTSGLEADRVDDFLRSFLDLRRRFESKWPAAVESDDYWHTIARQYDALDYRLMPSSRGASAAIYAHALRSATQLTRQLSWPRAAASVLLGRGGRERAARVLSRTRPS